MSAQGPPTPDELAEQFPITAMEAQMIADAMTPLQNLTGVGDSLGNAMEDFPGAGPKLAGSVLQTISTQVNLASTSAEALARAIDFYVTAQGGAVEELFPPPDKIAEQIERDTQVLRDLARPGDQ